MLVTVVQAGSRRVLNFRSNNTYLLLALVILVKVHIDEVEELL